MKDFFDKIKDFRDNNENGKMIFFFGFYLLFFLFLFILISTHRNPDYLLKKYEDTPSSAPLFSSDNIMRQNYMFDYKVTLDNVLYDYYGKRFNKVDSFKYNNLDYYRNEDYYFVNQGTWMKTDNPILFSDFFQEINVYKILKQATFDHKKMYDDGKVDYHFLLSSNTLFDIFYEKNTDYDEIPNKMIVTADSDNQVTKIVYYLNSYCSVIETCENTLTIEATYDLFGNIKKIDNPLE